MEVDLLESKNKNFEIQNKPRGISISKDHVINASSMITNKYFAFIDPFKTNHKVTGNWMFYLLFVTIIPSIILFSVLFWIYTVKDCDDSSTFFNGLSAVSVFKDFINQPGYHYCGSGYYVDGWYCCTIDANLESDEKMCKDFGEFRNCSSKDPKCGSVSDAIMYNVSYVSCKTNWDAFVLSLQITFYSQGVFILFYLLTRMVNKFGFKGIFELRNWKKLKGDDISNEV